MESARTPGSRANSPSSLSAGGQDEQPWLVNSSTTTRGDFAADALRRDGQGGRPTDEQAARP